MPYEKYVRAEILAKLHMDASTFEFSQVPADQRAVGYRLQPDGTYAEEPPLPQGAFGSAGGLLTTATDLGKYVAFHLSAWPPRDDAETGPVRRASVREMSHMWTPSNLTVGRSGRHVTGSRNRLRVRAAHFNRLPLRAHRWTRRRPAGVWFLHGMAPRLRCRNVCHGRLDVCWAVRAHQPGVGCTAENRRTAEARVAGLHRFSPRCAATS